jgi:hypothetical protein
MAIYLRDGLACAYCGAKLEDGTQLSLDHLTPRSKGGKNHAGNLVTCCRKCNSSRGNRPWRQFAADVATYLDIDTSTIVGYISRTIRRTLRVAEAREIMARRMED